MSHFSSDSETAGVIDADAHVNEDLLAWKALFAAFPGWLQAGQSGGKTVALIEGKLFPVQEGLGRGVPIESAISPPTAAGAADVNVRLHDLDTEGIAVQVLYGGLGLGVTCFEDVGFAAAFAEAYNDWLLRDFCPVAPSRLKGVAIVPLQSVDRAITEAARAAAAGAVAVTIGPVVGSRTLDDESLLPFFEAVADLGLALAIHSAPGMNVPLPAAGLFSSYPQVHALSFPVDQLVAFTALAMGGVLDRVPTLRVVFLESGIGWVPYYVHRVHEHREKRGDMLPHMASDPQELIARGQCYFSFEAEEPLLDVYVEHLGADSIVYSSDYPHWDCDFPGTVAEVRRRAAKLGDEVTTKILSTNAARLYRL